MNITPIVALAILIIGSVVYRLHFYRKKDKDEPIGSDAVLRQYQYILERIEGAATKTELAYVESLVYDFERYHRPHSWVDEMFTDLMATIQQKHNLLSAKEQIKVSS